MAIVSPFHRWGNRDKLRDLPSFFWLLIQHSFSTTKTAERHCWAHSQVLRGWRYWTRSKFRGLFVYLPSSLGVRWGRHHSLGLFQHSSPVTLVDSSFLFLAQRPLSFSDHLLRLHFPQWEHAISTPYKSDMTGRFGIKGASHHYLFTKTQVFSHNN